MAGPYPKIAGLRELADARGFELLRSWRKGQFCLVDRVTGNYARAPNGMTAFQAAQAAAFLEGLPLVQKAAPAAKGRNSRSPAAAGVRRTRSVEAAE